MADYFLDDAANGTNNGAAWDTCYNTWAQVASAGILTTSGNRLFVGADANITDPGAALTITGPTSGLPVIIISSTVGTGTTVSYSAGTGTQIDTTDGNNDITFDGSFALYGIKIASGQNIIFIADQDETFLADDCLFILGPGDQFASSTGASQYQAIFTDCEFDYSATSSGSTAICINTRYNAEFLNCVISNATNRTGSVFTNVAGGRLLVSGLDMSSCPSTCELAAGAASYEIGTYTNIITGATFAGFVAADFTRPGNLFATNVGPADAPTTVAKRDYLGSLLSSAAIYRTGGATVEGDACSWLITTTANCAEGAPFYTPWIYGTIASTGSKTFDLYITNDTADLTDAEAWLEVEYLSTSDEAIWALATDQRATITTTAAAQTDDTTSTWNGTGPSFTYKQKLSVSATVNETGQFRARVAVGKASIASSAYFYVDPKVTVS